MRRTWLFALPILFAASLVKPAAADDRDRCNDAKAGRESRLAACETAIAGRQWSGAELARLHVSRAEQYTFSRPRALDKALDDCNAAIAIDPKLAAAYRCRGVIYYERKEFDRAISEQDQALAINPRFAGAHLDRGRAFAAKHDQARALADFDEAIKINPKYASPYNSRGLIHYERGQLDAAIADLSAAIELDAKYTAPYYNRSRVFVRKRDLDRALADADAAIRIDPQYLNGYTQRGLVLKEMRNFDGALAAFDRAAELDPKSPWPPVGRGEVFNDRKDSARAIAEFNSAISKEFDRAIVDLNESIRLNPANPFPYWNRAISYENKRERDRALADWRTTLQLDPGNQNAIKAIRRLEQEKAAPGAVRKTRVALVIGNADYKYGGRLANPVNDAGDFANVLRTLGFEVIEGRNLDKRGMDEKIAEFARKLDKAGTGLFFYAGHGIQVDGVNWLIPVDARIEGGDLRPERAAAVKTASINITQVLSKMEAEQRVNLVFLDACRDNPFGRGTGFGQAKGLAPIQNAVGTLTAFSTKPDHVALDGDGRNSPFTTALLKHIPTPGLEIGTVMKRVRVDVIKSTKGEQVPFDESSLITDVVLAQ